MQCHKSLVLLTNHPNVNDYNDSQAYSLSNCTINNAYTILNTLGPGALMSKIDLKNAFCLIPVRPEDWNLLGISWHHKYFIDICLPFCLRSAPCHFNQLSIAIHWILQHFYNVQHLLHYLDDFFTARPAALQDCAQNLQSMLTLWVPL